MARRYGEPITVRTRAGQPTAFTWRGVGYRVRVIGAWRLATRWWAAETGATVDRCYFRVQASDQQIFEIYRETGGETADETADETGGTGPCERWVLDVCLD